MDPVSLDPPEPPPPGPAQRLVAKAGFTLYEAGNSIFDEPILVYLATSARRRDDFTVTDHIDRPLGATRALGNPGPFAKVVPTEIVDPRGSSVLSIRQSSHRGWSKWFRLIYEISGVANGMYTMSSVGSRELTLEANSEPFGYIHGAGFRGLAGKHLTLLDHDRRAVGDVRVFVEQRNPFHRTVSHVISFDPALGGELRRLLVAAPVVIEAVRRAHEASS